MGRRKGNGGGIGALLLGALAVILLIPKEVWIALFWFAAAAFLAWVGWRLYRNWQSAQQASVLPPPPEDTGKTLAEILGESSGKSSPAARRAGGPAPVLQVAPPPPPPSTPAITPPPLRPQATTSVARAVTEPSRPAPAQEPIPARTISPFSNWADNRDTIAAANRARTEVLRAKMAASDADHQFHAARLPVAESAESQAADDPALDVAPSVRLHQTPWETDRDQVASANRQRAEKLRAKYPDVRVLSEESTTPASGRKPVETPLESLGEIEADTKSSRSISIIMGESPGISPSTAHRTSDPPTVLQVSTTLPLSPTPTATPPPLRPQAAASFAPGRPAPAQEPVPARTTSFLRAVVDLASPIRQPEPPRWVPFGEVVSIRGQEVAGGGFYLGTPRSYQDSRLAAVDPTLPFSGQADWRGEGLGYWPRYAGLNDRERGTFLAFLNSERRAATVGIGYVFLYFYGLEHRLLRGLAAGESGRAEGQLILDEVVRLQQHYGSHGSFGHYSQELLVVGRFKLGVSDEATSSSDDWSLSQHVKTAQAVSRQQPLSADLAFAWAQALTDGARSTTWNVVRPEIKARFRQLYAQRFGEGLVVKPGRSKLALSYRWAGPGEGMETIQTDLPDITRSQAPIRPLVTLVQQAMGELEALRRVRRSKNGTPMAELAAMPDALRGSQVPATFRALASELDGLLADQAVAPITTSRLIAGCGMAASERLGKREATSLVQALEALGFAIEPDVRFHGHPPALDGHVMVFRLPDHAARTPSAAYAAAVLMLQAALAVAGQGSDIIQSELDVAVAAIERQFALPESERRRIEAHLRWLQLNPITLTRLENRVRLLPAPEREAFAGVLLEIAAADGHVTPAEVRVIERFYRALELDPARVPADLHHASVGGRPKASTGATLNADVIAEKLAETGRVQSVLAQIFNEAETPVAASAPSPAAPVGPAVDAAPTLSRPQEVSIPGLDAEHMVLLQRVLDVPEDQWSRGDFEAVCETMNLLPDGAAEMLNEAAFSVAGEPLLDGDDPMYVNDYVREQLTQILTDQKKPSP